MTTASIPPVATRDALGETLIKLREAGEDIVVVDADLGKSTSSRKFGEMYPERFITVAGCLHCLRDRATALLSFRHKVFAYYPESSKLVL